jgi:3-hydroxyisobutyrate dehydrogenase
MAVIGFIGLGNMGLPMAANLVKAGHEVLGFDAVPDVLQHAKDAKIITCAAAKDAADEAEIVVTMLPNGEIVNDVLDEILPVMDPGTLLIDCSTIDVQSAKTLHARAAEAGIMSIDCPVSGGIAGAAAGTLTFMIGGSEEACKKAEPVLDVMGARQVRCGDGGAGQAAKICNNMLLATTMIGVGEAFSLGKKLGLEAEALYDVMSTSSGSCWSINTYCPVPGVGPQSPADNDFKPGFATSLMIKDTTLAQTAAAECGQATPMGYNALELYKQFLADEPADLDFSGIITWLENAERG